MKNALILAIIVLALAPLSARAVTITGQQTAMNEWTYNLTFAPLDNYSVFQSNTTISLTGLFGAIGAAGPKSTDFPPFLNVINLDWTAEVLNGGTEVRWTHFGPGTGNFSNERHVFGFQVFANGATNGLVSLMTSGFSRDIGAPLSNGTYDLDIAGSIAGPVTVPEPGTFTVFAIGLAYFTIGKRRSRTQLRSGHPVANAEVLWTTNSAHLLH